MPWKEMSMKSERLEFVTLAIEEGANMSELCRRYGISRVTGYKWRDRFVCSGERGLEEQSRRPLSCPHQSPAETEDRIVALRGEHPRWGGRKLRRLVQKEGLVKAPAASTVTKILSRHELLNEIDGAGQPRSFQRFERQSPNELWQMDFKGHVALGDGQRRCHPLSLLDDHSRFGLCLRACADERLETVQAILIDVFRRYGLPQEMLMDNGAPWGDEGGQPWTRLTAWLVRLGIKVTHCRPRHPETQGKVERWHRTMLAELLCVMFGDLAEAQSAFDPWRDMYNTIRPHEALDLGVPADRYRESERRYPETLPAIEYGSGVEVRKVQSRGEVHFKGYVLGVSKAFIGDRIGVCATTTEGVYEVRYCQHRVGQVDLRNKSKDGPPVRMDRRVIEGV